MMNPLFRFFLSTLLALTISLAYNFFFLNLSERPLVDQILLIIFSTSALSYCLLSIKGGLSLPAIKKVDRAAFFDFMRLNAPGFILALIFFVVYTIIGLRLNSATIDTVDNYLDADNYSWMQRIASPTGYLLEMRGPHPFAYFIFRPLGWLMNLFTRNYWLSATLVNTLAGASCVFMAWLFVKRQSQNTVYALLIASLLGLSTAHIFFGSVIETYIFSAAVLIGFALVLQSQKDTAPSMALVGTSLLTFGITLTNFVQNFIGYVVDLFSRTEKFSKQTFWEIFKKVFHFSALTLSIGILVSLVHAAWYPSSKLFFLLSDAQTEEEFAISIFQEPQWRAIGRVILLIRTILLYTVIAPRPFVFGEEVGGKFPRFNFFRIAPEEFSYGAYFGIGNILVLAWAVLLFAAGLLFLWNLVRTRKANLALAFALAIFFNFLLHLNYGYEPFLYSPDWAYALVFFVALAFAPLAGNRFFQGALFLFLIFLAYNQYQFFQFIFETVAPFLPPGG